MNVEKNNIANKCICAAKEMRIDAIRATYNTKHLGAHIGGALSMIEIMAVLYLGVMNIDKNNITDPFRDRFILSKGHGVLAQYTAMKQIGIISDEDLLSYKQNNTRLFAHPSRDLTLGVEFSSGSLGQGVSLAVGVALALKRKNNNAKVYVLIGDGECDEGQIWEALLSAAQFKLDNLVVIVDKNGLQYDGKTCDILSTDCIKSKFEAFGFLTYEVNGHDVNELLNAFGRDSTKPCAIIANTIKGKGVSFMENNPAWHNGALTHTQYDKALQELEGSND